MSLNGWLASRPLRRPVRAASAAELQSLDGPRRGPHLLFAPAPRCATEPGGADKARPLLVFFHGAGGRGEQGLRLLRDTAAEHGLILLLPTSVGATWDVLTGGVGPDVAALDHALASVFDQHRVQRVAFSGFSDGASYALSLGLLNGDLAESVLAFSPGFVSAPAPAGQPRIWVSHGTDDPVLPADRCGRRVAALLRDTGYDVRYEEFEGGHVVPPEHVERALQWWLAPEEPPILPG